MTATHSPGPWHRNIKPATKYNTVWSGRNKHVLRMVVDGMSPEEVEANICLATEAPALLEALRPFAMFACSPAGECACHNCRARDVIARATGEQQ